MRILIVEDERDLANAVARAMRQQGYAADIAGDGEEALELASLNDYDLVILDLNLPKIDGIEVCRRLRKTGSTAGILMLTARSGVNDRILGLDQGADDYLVKPFHIGELLSRIRAILRREGGTRQSILKSGQLVLYPNTLKASYGETKLKFTLKEFAVAEYLLRNSGRFVSQEELIEHVWDEEADTFTQAIKVHIANIRKKLSAAGGDDVIKTIKGRGYMI